jgi:hypothetical protein
LKTEPLPCLINSAGSSTYPTRKSVRTTRATPVERFNGRISDILATTHFRSRDDLQTTITRYEKLYNEHLPQKALGHKTPLQAICAWREQKPELFVRKLKNQAGLDNYTQPTALSPWLQRPLPGSIFDRHGGSLLDRHQHSTLNSQANKLLRSLSLELLQ